MALLTWRRWVVGALRGGRAVVGGGERQRERAARSASRKPSVHSINHTGGRKSLSSLSPGQDNDSQVGQASGVCSLPALPPPRPGRPHSASASPSAPSAPAASRPRRAGRLGPRRRLPCPPHTTCVQSVRGDARGPGGRPRGPREFKTRGSGRQGAWHVCDACVGTCVTRV